MSKTDTYGPKSFHLSTARRTAEKIVAELAPWCDRIEIAGSIRRGRPFVGDIDIVVLPKVDQIGAILERCSRQTKFVKGADQYQVFEFMNGIQLDLWIAHHDRPEERDMLDEVQRFAQPNNFGMLLLSRTGSKEHNIYLAKVAQARGVQFEPHAGIKRAAKVIASAEELDIFQALNLEYVPPERREK